MRRNATHGSFLAKAFRLPETGTYINPNHGPMCVDRCAVFAPIMARHVRHVIPPSLAAIVMRRGVARGEPEWQIP